VPFPLSHLLSVLLYILGIRTTVEPEEPTVVKKEKRQ